MLLACCGWLLGIYLVARALLGLLCCNVIARVFSGSSEWLLESF